MDNSFLTNKKRMIINKVKRIEQKKRKTSNLVCFRISKTDNVKTFSSELNIKKKRSFIRGEYSKDFKILHTHSVILDKLQSDIKFELQKKIEWDNDRIKLRKKISNEDNPLNKNLLIEQLVELMSLNPTNTHNKLDEYNKLVKPILNIYKTIPKSKDQKLLEKNTKTETDYRRINCIEKFFNIAKKFIDIDVQYKDNSKNICMGCGGDINNTEQTEEGIIICINCGIQIDNIKRGGWSIISQNTGRGYERIKTFEKAFQCFQGKQNNTLPDSLFDKIDEYITNVNGITKIKALTLKLDNKGRKVGTSLGFMKYILKKLKLSSYFPNINLICKIYWGWELRDIEHLKTEVLEIYRLLNLDLSIQYTLFKILQMLDGTFIKTDFVCLTDTPGNLMKYDKIWKEACERVVNSKVRFIRTI